GYVLNNYEGKVTNGPSGGGGVFAWLCLDRSVSNQVVNNLTNVDGHPGLLLESKVKLNVNHVRSTVSVNSIFSGKRLVSNIDSDKPVSLCSFRSFIQN